MICALDGTRPPPAHEAFLIKGFSILRCPCCGLLWTRTAPDFDANSIYTEGYFQGEISDGYFDYLGSECFLTREYRARVSWIHDYLPQGRLLEIGCATGGFLQEAQRYYSVQGIDVSDFAVQAARQKGLDVSCGLFEMIGTLRPLYDAIIMFDTIEHVKDPLSTLRTAHANLRPGGFVFITTGDSQSLSARLLRSRWRLLTPPQHLWFFNLHSLSLLLEHLGFCVLTSRHPWRFVPLTLMWYQLFRGRVRPPPRPLDRIVVPVNLYDIMLIVASKRDDSCG
jgi:SAM-dependent methyltransferase